MASQIHGPDFLCIGMQKAATHWLYDQLRNNNSLWMPPLKELHFFDAGFNFESARNKFNQFIKRISKGEKLNRDDFRFFQHCFLSEQAARMQVSRLEFLDVRSKTRKDILSPLPQFKLTRENINWYSALFDNSQNKISGDITPAYSTISSKQVKHISEYFPDLKIILLVRDPIDRVWSQFRMRVRHGGLDKTNLNDSAHLAHLLENDENIRSRSYPVEIFNKWSQFYEKERIGVFFFEDVVTDPDKTRSTILEFLGVPSVEAASQLDAGYDRKGNVEKQPIPDDVRQMLRDYFKEEIKQAGEVFGRLPEAWHR